MAGISAGIGSAAKLPAAAPARPRPETASDAALSAAAAVFAALLLPQPPEPAPALKSRDANVEKGREGVEADASGSPFVLSAPSASDVRPAEPAPAEARPVAPPPPPQDPLGVERVESSRLPGRESIRIELAPDGPLGALTLRLAVRDGAVTATVLASSEAAAARLRADVEAARAALASRGVVVGSFVVAAPHAGDGAGMGREGDETDGESPLDRRIAPIGGERPSRRRRARFDLTV